MKTYTCDKCGITYLIERKTKSSPENCCETVQSSERSTPLDCPIYNFINGAGDFCNNCKFKLYQQISDVMKFLITDVYHYTITRESNES